jgi:hypothetical protein
LISDLVITNESCPDPQPHAKPAFMTKPEPSSFLQDNIEARSNIRRIDLYISENQ